MMTFEAPMYLTGDEPRAGYCGGCGEYVGPHHVCQPVEPKPASRCCQYCGGEPAVIFDVDGSWDTPECQRYDRQSETTIWRRWEQ